MTSRIKLYAELYSSLAKVRRDHLTIRKPYPIRRPPAGPHRYTLGHQVATAAVTSE